MKRLFILLGSMLLLCGCTESNIVKENLVMEPDTEIRAGIELNWAQVAEDMDEIYTNQTDYPMSISVNYNSDEEKKQVDLVLIVKGDTPLKDAAAYAKEVAKGFNDVIATQDYSYEKSSETSYGGYFKEYSLKVEVYPDEVYNDPMLSVTIPAGEYVDITNEAAKDTTK